MIICRLVVIQSLNHLVRVLALIILRIREGASYSTAFRWPFQLIQIVLCESESATVFQFYLSHSISIDYWFRSFCRCMVSVVKLWMIFHSLIGKILLFLRCLTGRKLIDVLRSYGVKSIVHLANMLVWSKFFCDMLTIMPYEFKVYRCHYDEKIPMMPYRTDRILTR